MEGGYSAPGWQPSFPGLRDVSGCEGSHVRADMDLSDFFKGLCLSIGLNLSTRAPASDHMI
eukprot:748407-Hanusia_phi.AAC.1